MNESLDRSGQLILADNHDFERVCAMTGDTISPGEPRIEINATHQFSHSDVTTHLAVDALDGLIDRLRDAHGSNERENLGETLTYLTEEVEMGRVPAMCPICTRPVNDDEARIATKDGNRDHVGIVHGECIPELCSALERTWEHGGKLLSELV